MSAQAPPLGRRRGSLDESSPQITPANQEVVTAGKKPSKEPEVTASGSAARKERMGVGVLVVDDQALFRRVALDVVAATPGFEPLGGAASGEEALVLASELEPELILLDVRMPVMDGIETARLLSTEHPEAVIFLISIDHSSELRDEVGFCGAKTLIRKQDFGSLALRRLWDAHGAPGSPAPRGGAPT